MADTMSHEAMLEELAEPVETLVHRHLENTKTWYPFKLVPLSMARDYTDEEPWNPDEYPLSKGVRSALYVNLLTEDNLPYYTETILNQAPRNHPLNVWTRRWTAEEGRHSIAIRGWAEATRALDPEWLEDGRMAQMSGGVVPRPTDIVDMLIYTSFQELATQVAHRNTGRKLGKERGGVQVMGAVAGDEALHHAFYSDAAQAALNLEPKTTIPAILNRLKHFDMPGTGIPGFNRHALAIAREGIYGVTEFLNSVVLPTLGKWAIADIPEADLKTDEAKHARDEIFGEVIPFLEEKVRRESEMREKHLAKTQAA
jgi:acyl-[acyl-carrier-protein] desaturase